jgi:hypothetical protein
MSELRVNMMVSLDGYAAGPGQSAENPFGLGGMQLNEWLFPLRAFRKMQGLDGGEVNESTPIVEAWFETTCATVMGRNMFGGGNLRDARPKIEQIQVVEASGVTHLRYRRKGGA